MALDVHEVSVEEGCPVGQGLQFGELGVQGEGMSAVGLGWELVEVVDGVVGGFWGRAGEYWGLCVILLGFLYFAIMGYILWGQGGQLYGGALGMTDMLFGLDGRGEGDGWEGRGSIPVPILLHHGMWGS